MKAIKFFSTPTAILTLCSAFLLSIAGCQKDELPTMNTNSSTNTSSFDQAAVPPSTGTAYQMISIIHTGVSSADKSYNVVVLSDDQLIFTGIRNTGILGSSTITLTHETMKRVREFFAHSNFYEFTPQLMSMDLRTLRVSFKNNEFAKIYTSRANENNTNQLSIFTQELEQILNIGYLVNGQDRREPLPHYIN